MRYEELVEPSYAVKELASRLVDGTLVLFVGAGTSMDFGMPDWIAFANAFRKEVGLGETLTKESKTEDIQSAIDEALDKIGNSAPEKIRIIRKVLYPDPTALDVNSALSHRLAVALCGLLIGARRGHVKKVVTFNYDSMLEWYLSLFGFNVRAIANLPADEGSEDVRIYHPHGFVPHPSLATYRDSEDAIVGLEDANLRASGDEWWDKERELLLTGMGLFVGLSANAFSDRAFQPHIARVSKQIGNSRPVGFWIVDGELSETDKKTFLRYDVVPVNIKDRSDIPAFILGICQAALELQTRK